MDIRSRILIKAYKVFPFPLKGDAEIGEASPGCDVSCVINFYGRAHLLRNILTCLSEQDYPKDAFEVVLVEDRGGTDEGERTAGEFRQRLNIRYFTVEENFGVMGYGRNLGLSKSRGAYVLFLDDDTVILDGQFLSALIEEFRSTGSDAVMPRGSASYCLVRERYSFHDPHFPTNRCMAYRKETLGELGGFVSEMIGQEDVEFTVRLRAAGKSIHRSNLVSYMHPPLILNNTNKAAAVGLSFAKLRNRYPLVVWIMLLLNGSRYLPKLLLPVSTKYRMQGKFSLGFTLGIWYSITGRKMEYN